MTRRKIRENLYIMLFRLDFYNKEEVKTQADIYLEEEIENASGKDKEELRNKFSIVLGHLEEIDAQIESKSKGWALNRIAKAELTVLRLAVFELLYLDDVPDSVAINEAVELAKLYCSEKSRGFINGVLASVVKEKEKNSKEKDKDSKENDACIQEGISLKE
ncbi:MAG: transcription antitermination factor NusB [Lachnospiraceae bacterium]